MTKITIVIELGNDDMTTRENVRDSVARGLFRVGATAFMTDPLVPDESGKLQDINGNTVGGWEVTA